MGLFSNLFRKTTTDVKFEKVAPQNEIRLENQNGVIDNCSREKSKETYTSY